MDSANKSSRSRGKNKKGNSNSNNGSSSSSRGSGGSGGSSSCGTIIGGNKNVEERNAHSVAKQSIAAINNEVLSRDEIVSNLMAMGFPESGIAFI